MLACYSMYVLGIVVAILTAYIISKIDGSKAEHALLIELPEYKAPNARTIAVYVWEKVKDYLTKAGTVIFLASIIMWVLLNFGPTGYVTDIAESFGSIIGKAIVPFFHPWIGILADRGRAHFGNCGKRSSGIKLQRAFWHPEYYHIPWYGQFCGDAGGNGIRCGKCIFAHGILPSVCAVHSDDRYDPQRGGK